jgi:hypothetical protein
LKGGKNKCPISLSCASHDQPFRVTTWKRNLLLFSQKIKPSRVDGRCCPEMITHGEAIHQPVALTHSIAHETDAASAMRATSALTYHHAKTACDLNRSRAHNSMTHAAFRPGRPIPWRKTAPMPGLNSSRARRGPRIEWRHRFLDHARPQRLAFRGASRTRSNNPPGPLSSSPRRRHIHPLASSASSPFYVMRRRQS